MDVHEYQAKEILASHGVDIPPGTVAFSPDQAVYAATELGGSHWVVKAQIHAGARGKAGGVKLCRTYHEVQQAARDLLGKRLVTGADGAGRQAGAARLCRGRRSFRARAVSGLRARPQTGARARHRLEAWRHGDRGNRQEHARRITAGDRRAGRRPAAVPGARTRLPTRTEHQAGVARGKDDHGRLSRFSRQ